MITIDPERGEVRVEEGGACRTYAIDSPEAFAAVSRAWLRCGWETKYVYTFTWLGRPIIQLPDDLLRIQEVIYALKPDVILETGIAHGGSLVFYASLCKVMGRGRVIGVDVEIRPHNRAALDAHELRGYITCIEGSSIAAETIRQVHALVRAGESVLVVLDSNHTKDHVRRELEAYARLVSVGSYVVAADGIMRDLVGASRAAPDWATNNPIAAVEEFLGDHPEFRLEQPSWPFNESAGLRDNVTYWPGAWLRRLR
jgi:cephalosporin hydroxylase